MPVKYFWVTGEILVALGFPFWGEIEACPLLVLEEGSFVRPDKGARVRRRAGVLGRHLPPIRDNPPLLLRRHYSFITQTSSGVTISPRSQRVLMLLASMALLPGSAPIPLSAPIGPPPGEGGLPGSPGPSGGGEGP